MPKDKIWMECSICDGYGYNEAYNDPGQPSQLCPGCGGSGGHWKILKSAPAKEQKKAE
jgi:DnaJ-class molecular chaperone